MVDCSHSRLWLIPSRELTRGDELRTFLDILMDTFITVKCSFQSMPSSSPRYNLKVAKFHLIFSLHNEKGPDVENPNGYTKVSFDEQLENPPTQSPAVFSFPKNMNQTVMSIRRGDLRGSAGST
jgi:hypothetical protein